MVKGHEGGGHNRTQKAHVGAVGAGDDVHEEEAAGCEGTADQAQGPHRGERANGRLADEGVQNHGVVGAGLALEETTAVVADDL